MEKALTDLYQKMEDHIYAFHTCCLTERPLLFKSTWEDLPVVLLLYNQHSEGTQESWLFVLETSCNLCIALAQLNAIPCTKTSLSACERALNDQAFWKQAKLCYILHTSQCRLERKFHICLKA